MKTAIERREDAEGIIQKEVDRIMEEADKKLSAARQIWVKYKDFQAAKICEKQLNDMGYSVSISRKDNYKYDNEINIRY